MTLLISQRLSWLGLDKHQWRTNCFRKSHRFWFGAQQNEFMADESAVTMGSIYEKTTSSYNIYINTLCSEGYGLLLESSVTFLMLCWTQTLCWSSSFSLRARSSNSAFRSISLSAISLVLHPGPTPLKHKRQIQYMVMYSQHANTASHTHLLMSTCCFSLTPCLIIAIHLRGFILIHRLLAIDQSALY